MLRFYENYPVTLMIGTCYDTGNHTGAIEYYDKAKAIKWTLCAPKDHHHCVIHVTSIIRFNIIRPVLKSAKDD